MGHNSSKIKDFLYVTGQEFDPPQPKVKRPKTQPKFDYRTYLAKKYYRTDVSDKEADEQLAKIQKKQQILKMFKHHEDFDRINYNQAPFYDSAIENTIQDYIKVKAIFSLIVSKIICVQFLGDNYTLVGNLRTACALFMLTIPFEIIHFMTIQNYHIVNHEFFRTLSNKMAERIESDYAYDVYKDLQDVKYNFKYPSVREFYETKRNVLFRYYKTEYRGYRDYYLYEAGLKIDPVEQFIKSRQSERAQRKNNTFFNKEDEEKVLKDISSAISSK